MTCLGPLKDSEVCFWISDQCDLQKLVKPKFAENWLCDKPIEDNKVPKKTKCEIVCPDGYDIKNGECVSENLHPINRLFVRNFQCSYKLSLTYIYWKSRNEIFTFAVKMEYGKKPKMLFYFAFRKVSFMKYFQTNTYVHYKIDAGLMAL